MTTNDAINQAEYYRQYPGNLRLNTCPDCGHYSWAHDDKGSCVAAGCAVYCEVLILLWRFRNRGCQLPGSATLK